MYVNAVIYSLSVAAAILFLWFILRVLHHKPKEPPVVERWQLVSKGYGTQENVLFNTVKDVVFLLEQNTKTLKLRAFVIDERIRTEAEPEWMEAQMRRAGWHMTYVDKEN